MSLNVRINNVDKANRDEPFWGSYESLTDQSRRVNIPAKLREKIENRAKIMDQEVLKLYGVIKKEKDFQYVRVYDYPPINHKAAPHEINELELQGKKNDRFSIPKNLIDFSDQGLVFAGGIKYFDIYSKKDWQKKVNTEKAMARSYTKGAERRS